MRIEIVYPGRVKNAFARAGFEEYIKRSKRLVKVETVSIPASKSTDPFRCVEDESQKLLKYLLDKEYVLLDVKGRELDTKDFTDLIKKHIDFGKDLIFVVGGVFGVSDEIKKRAATLLSLSKMTFTHSISLMLLSEQFYRATKILSGHPYDH